MGRKESNKGKHPDMTEIIVEWDVKHQHKQVNWIQSRRSVVHSMQHDKGQTQLLS